MNIDEITKIIIDNLPNNCRPCNSVGERLQYKDIKGSRWWHIQDFYKEMENIAKAVMAAYEGSATGLSSGDCVLGLTEGGSITPAVSGTPCQTTSTTRSMDE